MSSGGTATMRCTTSTASHEIQQVAITISSPKSQSKLPSLSHHQGASSSITSTDINTTSPDKKLLRLKKIAEFLAISLSAVLPCASLMCLPKIKGKSIENPMIQAVDARQLKRVLFNTENGRLMVYLIVLFAVTLSIDKLRKLYVLNLSPLWQWELFLIVIVGGYALTKIFSKLLIRFLELFYDEAKSTFYYIKGLRQAIHFMFFTGLVLLTNVIYFTNTNLNGYLMKEQVTFKGIPVYKIFIKYLDHTSLAFFVGSILWLLKSILILQLKAATVYSRLEEKIIKEVAQFYFLALFYEPYRDLSQLGEAERKTVMFKFERRYSIDSLAKIARRNLQQARIQRTSAAAATLHDVQHQARYLIDLAENTKAREDNTDEILRTCKDRLGIDHQAGITEQREIDQHDLRELKIMGEDADLFFKLLVKEDNKRIPYAALETWLVNANRSCLHLGYNLVDCRAAVEHLGYILNALVFFLTFLWWLVMTGKASTKVLLIIAYPFTAGTVMFQTAGKEIFQGIVFTFLKHPFDVGDLCIINGTKLEVKRMGITKTLFRLPGADVAELYLPNSFLTDKPIANLQRIPDANDSLNIYLDLYTSETSIKKLLEKIREYLKDEKDGKPVIVKAMEDCIKIIVRFKYGDASIYEMTHSKFFEMKDEFRSKLLLDIKRITEELDIKLVAPLQNTYCCNNQSQNLSFETFP